MTAFFSDAFTASNGTALDAYSAAWGPHSTDTSGYDPTIESNRVRCHPDFAAHLWYNTAAPAGADYTVSCDLYKSATSTSNSLLGVVGRLDSAAATYYWGRYRNGNTDFELAKVVTGTFTVLGSYDSAFSSGATRNVKLEMIGTAIKVYIDGGTSAVISVTDSAITAAGAIGFRMSQSVYYNLFLIDNFAAEDVAGAAVASLPFPRTSQRFQHMMVR